MEPTESDSSEGGEVACNVGDEAELASVGTLPEVDRLRLGESTRGGATDDVTDDGTGGTGAEPPCNVVRDVVENAGAAAAALFGETGEGAAASLGSAARASNGPGRGELWARPL